MGRPGGAETRAQIREASRRILRDQGPDALTLDEVAAAVGVTRQAVLYHFGSREGLMAESLLEVLEAESTALIRAAEAAPRGLAGAGPFLQAAVDWYLSDLSRVRLFAIQQVRPLSPKIDPVLASERVYPTTGRMYSAIEAMLAGGDDLPEGVDARRLGIALHMFALGVAGYQAMLDATGDTFRHDWHDVAADLARALTAAPR